MECKLAIDIEEYVAGFRPELMEYAADWCLGARFQEIQQRSDFFEVINGALKNGYATGKFKTGSSPCLCSITQIMLKLLINTVLICNFAQGLICVEPRAKPLLTIQMLDVSRVLKRGINCPFIVRNRLPLRLQFYVMQGSLVRAFRRIEEVLRQLISGAKVIGDSDLAAKLEECSESIRRGVVFAASLYL